MKRKNIQVEQKVHGEEFISGGGTKPIAKFQLAECFTETRTILQTVDYIVSLLKHLFLLFYCKIDLDQNDPV